MSAHETVRPGRVVWIDVARALGIALVVLGHVERGLRSGGILQDGGIWQQIDFVIYTFHMPLFFYLSGMNVQGSREKPGFFAKRARALILPYFVFSILQGLVKLATGGKANSEMAPLDLLLIPVFPISPFWFLYVLFIYIAVVSFWRPGWPMMALAVAMLLLSPLAGDAGWIFFQLLYFFAFYVAGILLRPGRIPAWAGLAALAVWGGTCLAGLRGLAGFGPLPLDQYYHLAMLPAAIGGTVALIWLAQRASALGEAGAGAGTALLSYMGRNVIAIYVMHILATAGVRIILSGFGIHAAAPHVILGTLCGIALPLLALAILQKLRAAPLVGLPAR